MTSEFTGEVLQAFVKAMGSCLIVGPAQHKNTSSKVERANGVIGDTLRAFSNGRRDDWDVHLPIAAFRDQQRSVALNGGLTPFFIDRGAHPRRPLSAAPPAGVGGVGETPAGYAARMKAIEAEVRALILAAQRARKAALDPGRVDTVFQLGDRVMLRTIT